MALRKQEVISAQVALRSASGRSPDGRTMITAETLKEFLPSAETVDRALEAFSGAGFQVGAMVGRSFSITAPVALFESFFKTRLQQGDKGAIQSVNEEGRASQDLSLKKLPVSISSLIESVSFSPPPDFGPSNF